MNIKSKNNVVNNYRAFNLTLTETPNGLKVVSAFGASSLEAPEENWKKLDARNVARAIQRGTFVTR